ncbi:MAG: hypothetical protein AB1393_10780 [Candidatus Edwardsbacteria bacterium]
MNYDWCILFATFSQEIDSNKIETNLKRKGGEGVKESKERKSAKGGSVFGGN